MGSPLVISQLDDLVFKKGKPFISENLAGRPTNAQE